MTNKKGLWIALGTCGVLVFAGIAFVGLVIFLVVRHLEVRPVSTASAEQEYSELRTRFTGQRPMIEIDRDDPGRVQVHRPPEKQDSVALSTLHIFVWNRHEGKVVRLDLPFWLLRLKPESRSIRWNWHGGEMDFDNLQVTVEDLERHGPGLIVDFEGRRGERLLVWAE